MFHVQENRDRSSLLSRFNRDELVQRYKENFGLTNIKFERAEADDLHRQEQVARHAELEGRLTDELLESTPENRTDTFSKAYTKLYSELPWLVGTGTSSGAEHWASLMKPGSSVYEIGSGAGYVVRYLGQRGFRCVGTDLSAERERVALAQDANVSWATTDGVHLSRFSAEEQFDYVISDQVVEHLHPDEILTHFKEARKLLKVGGCYIMRTPYAPEGPADLSVVFGEAKPVFMHLHEFGYDEIEFIRKTCGYRKAKAVLRSRRLALCKASSAYFLYCVLFDKFENFVQRSRGRSGYLMGLRRKMFCPRSVWVVLER